MSIAGKISPFSIHTPFVDLRGRLTPYSINSLDLLVNDLNEFLKNGKDTQGASPTNQQNISFLNAPLMTTTVRDSVNATNGLIIYNTDVNKFQGFAGGVWVDFH